MVIYKLIQLILRQKVFQLKETQSLLCLSLCSPCLALRLEERKASICLPLLGKDTVLYHRSVVVELRILYIMPTFNISGDLACSSV